MFLVKHKNVIKQKSPQDILKGILDVILRMTNLSKEFWFYWKHYEDFYKSFKEELLELHNFLKNSVYSEYIPQTKEVSNLVLEIINLMKELDELYKKADNPKGFFKTIKSKKAMKLGNEKLSELNSKIESLYGLINKISKEYPTRLEDKKKILLAKFPYLEVSTYEDYQLLSYYERENIFQSKIFRMLDKYVFHCFGKNKLSMSRLNLLLQKLKDPNQYKIYFYNLARFRRYYKDYEAKHYPIDDETMFFDTQFFDMYKFWYEIPTLASHCLIPEFLYFRTKLIRNRESGNDTLNNLAYKALRRLSSTNIKIEEEAFRRGGSARLIFELTEGIVDLLVLFGIRKIHNLADIDLIRDMFPLSQKHDDFKREKLLLAKIWNNVIEKSARDLPRMDIFLMLYDKLGINFFKELVKNRIVLSSSDIHDLDVQTKFESLESLDPKSLILRIRSKGKGRKLILVTAPKEDYNLAFQSMYEELKEIPKDKFEVHFAFITAANQLALLIKKVAARKKIDIILISGHGSPGGVSFGYVRGGYIDSETLKSKLFNGINKCFSKDAVCYLLSCSAGAGEENIAKRVAKRFGIKTYAPPIDVSSRIVISPEGQLEIKYSGTEPKMFLPSK